MVQSSSVPAPPRSKTMPESRLSRMTQPTRLGAAADWMSAPERPLAKIGALPQLAARVVVAVQPVAAAVAHDAADQRRGRALAQLDARERVAEDLALLERALAAVERHHAALFAVAQAAARQRRIGLRLDEQVGERVAAEVAVVEARLRRRVDVDAAALAVEDPAVAQRRLAALVADLDVGPAAAGDVAALEAAARAAGDVEPDLRAVADAHVGDERVGLGPAHDEAVAGRLGDGDAAELAVAGDGDAALDDDGVAALTDERDRLVDAQVADVAAGAHDDARARLDGGERVAHGRVIAAGGCDGQEHAGTVSRGARRARGAAPAATIDAGQDRGERERATIVMAAPARSGGQASVHSTTCAPGSTRTPRSA